jgi:hypothetical protein
MPVTAMRFCWPRNSEPIRIIIDEIRGRREAQRRTFLLPAPWVCSPPVPSKDCWTSETRWTAYGKLVSTFQLRSSTD